MASLQWLHYRPRPGSVSNSPVVARILFKYNEIRTNGLAAVLAATNPNQFTGASTPMQASSTLPQHAISPKSPFSKTGVFVLAGFGIKVRLHCGHLELEDGVGMERRTIR